MRGGGKGRGGGNSLGGVGLPLSPQFGVGDASFLGAAAEAFWLPTHRTALSGPLPRCRKIGGGFLQASSALDSDGLWSSRKPRTCMQHE